jgi:hypothetical protein
MTTSSSLLQETETCSSATGSQDWIMNLTAGLLPGHHGCYALNTTTKDGRNLVLYSEDYGNVILWTTSNVVGNMTATSHALVMDGLIHLKLQEDGVEVWENIKKIPPFKGGSVLQKGEMFCISVNMGWFL